MARKISRKPEPATPAAAPEEQLPVGARDIENAEPVDQGRVPPVRSRDEANIKPGEALPNDEEERSIADNLSREEVIFDELKRPGKR